MTKRALKRLMREGEFDAAQFEPRSDDGKIRRLPIAPLLAEAIRRIADESSVSSLFD